MALAENGFEKLDHYDGYFENLAVVFSPEKILLPSSLGRKNVDNLLKLMIIKISSFVFAYFYIYLFILLSQLIFIMLIVIY